MAEPFVPSDYSGISSRFGSYQNYSGIGKENPFGKTFSVTGGSSPEKSMFDITPVPVAPATPQAAQQPVVPPTAMPGQPPAQMGSPSTPFSLPTLNLPTTQSLTDAVRKHLGEF
jgi:hypothetical protein